MLSRRELIAGGVAGRLTLGSAEAEAGAQEADRAGQREIANRIQALDRTLSDALLSNSLAHGTVAKVRAQMELFFRSNSKFPDFMEIGMGVFMDLYDWHVRNRQQLVIQRAPDGRYWMQFMFTNLVLRGELDAGHVGIPYDKA